MNRLAVVVGVLAIGALLVSPGSAGARPARHRKDHGRIGSWLLEEGRNETACEYGLERHAYLQGHAVPSYGRNYDLAGPRLLPGGIFLISCGRDALGEPEAIVAYDLVSGRPL